MTLTTHVTRLCRLECDSDLFVLPLLDFHLPTVSKYHFWLPQSQQRRLPQSTAPLILSLVCLLSPLLLIRFPPPPLDTWFLTWSFLPKMDNSDHLVMHWYWLQQRTTCSILLFRWQEPRPHTGTTSPLMVLLTQRWTRDNTWQWICGDCNKWWNFWQWSGSLSFPLLTSLAYIEQN